MTLQEPRFERPPEGLARGRYPAPPWVIAALASILVLGAIGWLVRRMLRARRDRGAAS